VNELRQSEIGSHYIVIYPDMPTVRELYTSYAKTLLEKGNKELVVILPFYEDISSVRYALSEVLDDVRKYEREQVLLIVDSYQAYFYTGIFSLAQMLINKAINSGMKGVSILGDMSSFYFNDDDKDDGSGNRKLLDYELSLPPTLKNNILKGFCLYHQADFNNRFTQNQKQGLLEHHGKSLLIIKNS
jgi:MEDS: MEthanogen/methylotroph, DcmR Sensory domain